MKDRIMKKLIVSQLCILFIFISSHAFAEIKCSVKGGASLGTKTTQKLYYDIFKAVKRLGWSTAKDLKSCNGGDMRFPRVPMETTNGEFIVFDTQRAFISYQRRIRNGEILCYDMKLKKSYRKNANECY